MFAYAATLAQGHKDLNIAAGSEESVRVSMVPMIFISPWTYFEDGDNILDENADIELVEEEEDEEDDDDETA